MNMTYKDAGVDITAGNQLVERIKPLVAKTHRNGVMGNIGGFGALFDPNFNRYTQPILVSSTDGVGTKLKVAIELNHHHTIGIDLVAMCVNDLIVQGAEPLFFLDYFATGKLDVNQGEQIITGIAKGCEEAKVALIGGETAEMPGVYQASDYDLAGFAVGIVEKSKIIMGHEVKPDDLLIALPSSGLHSNGYSLARKIIKDKQIELNQSFDNQQSFGEILMTPTRIYVNSILNLVSKFSIKAMAHITGGGILENLPRVLPDNLQATIHTQSWDIPAIFNWLKQAGNLTTEEMFRTFNCGIGMILCIGPDDETSILSLLKSLGENPWKIGTIDHSNHKKTHVDII